MNDLVDDDVKRRRNEKIYIKPKSTEEVQVNL